MASTKHDQSRSSTLFAWAVRTAPRSTAWLLGPPVLAVVGFFWTALLSPLQNPIQVGLSWAIAVYVLGLLILVALAIFPWTRPVARWLSPTTDFLRGVRADLSDVTPDDLRFARQIVRNWPRDVPHFGLATDYGTPARPKPRYAPIDYVRSVPLGLELAVATIKGIPADKIVRARDDVAAAWGVPVDIAATTQQQVVYLLRLRNALDGTRRAATDQPDIPEGWLW